ncbi:Toxin HigB-2 [compost metagenome]
MGAPGNYTQIAHECMKALFVELTSFERQRKHYLNDDEYSVFQQMLLNDPEAGP